jgi:AcrR family transcriptional regulator
LARAADIGSAEGLEGLSIGRLATECGTSKSNVAAHFGTKERLQLAAVEYASDVFAEAVVVPAMAAPKGLARLLALNERWMDYSRRRVFSGGCFFAAVTAEYDARDGALRDALRDCRAEWIGLQQRLVAQAQSTGELSDEVGAAQLAFELDAFAQAANTTAVLYDDDTAYDRAAAAIRSRLDGLRLSTDGKD